MENKMKLRKAKWALQDASAAPRSEVPSMAPTQSL